MKLEKEQSKVKAMNIDYADRFKWQNAMRASQQLTTSTKVVLSAILEATDKRSGLCIRTYAYIAKMTGLKERGVRGCCEKAEREGWIVGEGKGGIIHDEDGNAHGLAKKFRLTVPVTAVTRYEGDTCHEDGLYLSWNCDLPVMKLSDTCHGHDTNTPLFSPIYSPDISHTRTREEEIDRSQIDQDIDDTVTPAKSEQEELDLSIEREKEDPVIPVSGNGHEKLSRLLRSLGAPEHIRRIAFDRWTTTAGITHSQVVELMPNAGGRRRDRAA